PKCVQLTHKNILTQQAALQSVWTLDENDRFLSYLPWHHSFGGIFERFSALYNGCTIALESGYGKDPEVILENWKIIQPTLFFSVPKVYQTLIELTKADSKAEELFFHSQLKFIFTAAASLPKNISDEFEKRGVQVVEGWGLTETSPCCTLTDPSIKREQGVVGKPIPGVTIRIATDGEIQVKGPNVMAGYYKNDDANKTAFTEDGWYCTGDVGEITPSGLKLISRKDRIFKLLNGEKVIPTDMEFLIQNKCHYIMFAMVVGSGKEYPVALLFPNKKMLDNPHYELSPEEGCFCPRNLNELGRCLQGCLHDANCGIGEKFSKIKSAILIDDELSIEKNTLTPSLKAAPNNIMKAYKAHIENLYHAGELPLEEEVYIIKLDTLNQTSIKSIT
ncbi:MAG TPA: AMP-binding protein, partial [Bacteroidia bacterium]